MSDLENVYRGELGQHITHAAADACDLASARDTVITLVFNDIETKVLPGQHPNSVVEDWQRGMDAAGEAYRNSREGRQDKIEADDRLAKAQSKHDAAMSVLPAKFPDARAAILWLISFSDAADHINIVGRDFGRVVTVLEASGWSQGEACGLPKHEYENADILGRWIIGQAIDMLRKNLPPHSMLMEKFAADFLALSENN